MGELYGLPEGWEWKKISETFKIRSGKFLPKRNMVENGQYDVYGGNGINGKYDEYNLDGENIVIGRVGALCGNVRYVNDFIWLTDNAFYISEYLITINPIYLSKYLAFIDLGKTANQAAQPVISYKSISVLDIPLPPLQEQKRIVAKLDSLFARIDQSIALHQQNIDEAEGFMGSVLNEVFGELEGRYEKKELKKIIKIIGGGTPSKSQSSYWTNGNIKWATVGDMNVETITNTKLSITEKGLKNSSSNIIPKEGIIIATRVGLGKVCYLGSDMAINQDLKGLIPLSESLELRYLYNYFKYIGSYIISNGAGATVKGVKLDFIKSLKMPFPSIETQQKTVTYLDQLSQKIEKLIQAQQEKMQSLKDLKASLLDRAFRGEI